jgi:hypothetical protein
MQTFEENIAEVQVLLQQRSQIDERLKKLIVCTTGDSTPQPKERKQYTKRTVKPSTSSGRWRKLTEDEHNTVILLNAQSIDNVTIAGKLGVPTLQVAQIIRRHNEKKMGKKVKPFQQQPNSTRHVYKCPEGDTFTSNLPIGQAMCPYCKSKELKPYVEPPVKESQ